MAKVFGRRLILLAAGRTADGGGGFRRGWDARGGLWAEVRMRSGGLAHDEFGRAPRLRLRITTHGLPVGHPMRPAPGDRLQDGARLFEVEAVHDGERRHLVILASEVPDGEGAR
ncbi:head-tail adaptor protein [Jannaschia rubra]|uniref:Phage head-tail joining protein n=1 Tax=Jannaschia rubra TaxID=282197 RepID=A0A0M6XSY5_9RHOB|nr:head-tail adaptor protein [Jannaschia rubra]CTQ34239.1 Phage head-tail joining protein [Jannaschia rubra]SFG19810.1 Phage head-tail joining protein [Jannaschia rubra]